MTASVIYRTDTENILRSVDIVFQVMTKATINTGGLFPAVAERHIGQLLMDWPLPPVIPGQRNSDRAPRGNNLSHDVALLQTLDGLDRALGRKNYRLMYDDYLKTWATVCATASPTGLLPWGEHAFWGLKAGCIQSSYILQYHEQACDASLPTHHQLGILPVALWQELHKYNDQLLPRFVDGLDWHWMDDERTQFNRHAPITQFIRGHQHIRHKLMTNQHNDERPSGSDFPGAAGVFIHDYAAALALVDKPKDQWKTDLLRFADSWWDRRLDSGLLPKSGGKGEKSWNGVSLGQTLGMVNGLLAAGELLKQADPELSATLLERAATHVKAVLDVEQPLLHEGKFCSSYNADGSPFKHSQPWAGNRGQAISANQCLKVLQFAQAIGDERGLEMATRCGEAYLEQRLPRNTIVRAKDPANVIAFVSEIYRLTGEQRWLDAALIHATDALELYFDCPLPRMATGRSHYEPQQGSSELVHALARLVLIADGMELTGGMANAAV